jgi:aspartate aminotransferase-like enzyme
MVIIMNISEEKRTQICAAFAKAQQDIKRIQAVGAMDISEVERVYRALQDVVQELRILIDQ